MLPLRYRLRWRVAGVSLLGAVFLGALVPAIWFRHSFAIDLLSGDKLAHALAFLFLTLWFSGQYAPQARWRILSGLMVFGAMIELSQLFTPSRSGEWLDLLADLVGIVLGLFIASAGVGGWSLRVENWLLERAEARQ